VLKPSGRLVTVAASGDFSDDGKRFVVRADERLTAFLALELAIRIRHDRT